MSVNKTWYFSDHSQTPSDDVRALFTTVNIVYLNVIVAVLGIGSNVINILVFTRQGFGDNVNISLFSLAVADLGSLVFVLFFIICSNPAFAEAVRPVEALDLQSLVASFPRGTLGRITSCITAFVTFERSLSVTLPLRVKRIITAKVTMIVMGVIYMSLGLSLIPLYLRFNLGWSFDISRNQTVFVQIITDYTGPADHFVTFSLHTCIQIISYLGTIVFTTVIIVEIKRKSKWRNKATSSDVNAVKNSNKKVNKTVGMIITMATVYIVCYTPGIGVLATYLLVPEFQIDGFFQNAFKVAVSFNILFESVNASVSIVLYYSTSVKFRSTFRKIWCNSSVNLNDKTNLYDKSMNKVLSYGQRTRGLRKT